MAQHKQHNPWPGRVAAIGALALAAQLAMAPAFADTAASDGDGPTVLNNSNWALGSVCLSAPGSRQVPVYITRASAGGPSNAYGSSTTVNVTADVLSAGIVSVPNSTKKIDLPASWGAASNGTTSDTVQFPVSYTAPSSTGAFSRTVRFTATGTTASNALLVKTDDLVVSGTAVVCDNTPPVITPSITGTQGSNGWYTTNVGLSWTVTDAQSAITNSSGCGSTSITADQPSTTYTCTATSAGGTSSQSVTIKRDATKPTVQFGVTPADTYEGEASTAPTCTASDASPGSGLNGLCSISGYTTALGQHTLTASVSDLAGNAAVAATDTYVILDDTSSPNVGSSVSGTQGSNDWYLSDAVVGFTVTEPETPASLTQTGGCAGATLSTDSTGTTYSCGASSLGGTTAPVTVTVKRDATPPTNVSFVGGPADNGSYYEGEVPVAPTCTADDATSGFESCSVSGYDSTSLGLHTLTATAYDNAGNAQTASRSYTVVDDITPPVITPAVVGTLKNGWYSSDVGVTFTVTDPETPGSITKGSNCDPVTVTADTDGATYACNASSLGGSSGNSIVIKRDTVAPTLTGAATTSPNGDGWYKTDVTIKWTGNAGLMGAELDVTTQPADSVISAEGSNLGAGPVTIKDLAGNESTPATVAGIKIDKTAPSITPDDVLDTTWRNTSLSQDFTASDGGSGLKTSSDASFTLTASDDSADSSTPTTDSKTVEDVAGNSTTRTVSAKIDTVKPTISDAGTTSTPNANGWYSSAVVESFTASDALSGLPLGTSPFTKSSGTTEGSAVKINSGSVTDNAGNVGDAVDSPAYKIDLSDPRDLAFVGGPSAGASYPFGSVPAAPTCTALDDVSGLAGCVVTGHATGTGPHTMTATATDKAGRTMTVTRSFTVAPWTMTGFYQPVDMAGVLNTVKAGSTVPLKFEAFAGTTELTQTSAINALLTKSTVCGAAPEDGVEVTATGGTSLRYDSSAGQFIYNWQTPKSPGTCLNVTVLLDDGSSKTALFKLK